MAEDLLFRIGETKRILHEITADDAFTLTSVAAYIWDENGAAVVNGSAGTVSSGSAVSHQVYFAWTPTVAGDYTYQLRYVVGSQTIAIPGTLAVLPAVSKFDRYCRRVVDWLQDAEVGEAQAIFSWAQVRDAVRETLERYSEHRPQRKLNGMDGQALTSGVWEYALPADWVTDFSQIETVEYPVDSAVQDQAVLAVQEWYVDELRGKWGFADLRPGAGEYARLTYTTRHEISDSAGVDTVPSRDFASLCQYAAGLLLLQAANRAAGTTGPQIAADAVSYRTKQQEYLAQSRAMMQAARRAWGGENRPLAAIGSMDYLPLHGKIWSI